ncbi:PREDICTED: uncharacterized protein LOC108568953 isoform X1 [Nicrophorus vespilloides]|uniref:Uncharacterized protein LOC108568953 isoform X1 n=1 Tax=Nicrophorus vespilloides TaxID=110193 RepID=A0ABM1NG49_NICVS|nr:PREDICTED: uncharacterized protein LOC108568953 isoform X1 [Nicrophorus vespilloides]
MITNMCNTNIPQLFNNGNPLIENTYLKVEMVDGTTQLIQLTREQGIALGIDLTENIMSPNEIIQVENVCINPIKEEPIYIKSSELKTRYNCKIIQPEDLNLKPNIAVPPLVSLPRGRPRKKVEENVEPKPLTVPKIVKTTRTRSGRITRPPMHMEKDYEKIIVSDDRGLGEHKDLSTVEFDTCPPPKKIKRTTKENTTNPKTSKEAKRKRLIPAQYRCTYCHKAYLGRNRIMQHLNRHPEHETLSQFNMEDSETWSFLIELALKSKVGNKGTKFCKEILNLIRNARILVKYFFKPVKVHRSQYYVDSLLASILNIKEGDYRFSESELCKDVSIFSFLELLDDNFADHVLSEEPRVKPLEKHQATKETSSCHNILSLGDELDCNKKLNENNMNLHFESDIMDVLKESNKDLFEDKEVKNHNGFVNTILDDLNEAKPLDKRKNNYDTVYSDNNFSFENNTKNENFEVKSNLQFDKHGKEIDIFPNTIHNILSTGASDENINILSENKIEKDVKGDVKSLYNDIMNLSQEKKELGKKGEEFDLHKLHLLSADISDELILPDTSGHVSNILDTSTSSDDIMNVDQFVNERFKKLTEVEEEISTANGLSLDLPALDCFNFHTS